MIDRHDATVWACRAESLLELALDELRTHGGGDDAVAALVAAEVAMRIDLGEVPEVVLDGYPFPGEPDGRPCICSAEQLERGGFKGGCPVHAACA